MRRTQHGTSGLGLVIGLFVLICLGGSAWILLAKRSHAALQRQQVTTGMPVTISGTVDKMELAGLASDLPAVYTVSNSSQSWTVQVAPPQAKCDHTAITVPTDVKVGTAVAVHGYQGNDSVVRICRSGTYIKASR